MFSTYLHYGFIEALHHVMILFFFIYIYIYINFFSVKVLQVSFGQLPSDLLLGNPWPSASLGELRRHLVGRDAVLHLGVCDGPVLLPQVQPQLAFVAEVQVALLTMIRFLARVDSKVAFEGLQVPETCATDLTGVWLLPSMNEHMSTEVGHLDKSGPTGLALVGFLSGVNTCVGFQVGWPVELRPTDVAAVRLFSCVDGLVAGEVPLVAEGGLAAVALVGFVAVDLQRVPLERGLLGEPAVTLVAEEGSVLAAGVRVLRLGFPHLLSKG